MALKELLEIDDWKDVAIPSFSGGLSALLDPSMIELNELIRAQNVHINGDRIVDTPGYSKFRGTIAVLGTPMDVISFDLVSGAKTSLLVTTLSLYIDNGTQWRLVSTSVGSTCTANEITNATVIDVASTVGFVAGNPVYIELDNGAFHHATINSISAGVSITISVGIPSAASIGNDVRQGYKFTGDEDDIFSMVAIPWSDQVVITNGLDQVQVYSNSTGQIASLTNPAGITVFLAKCLAVYDSSLWAFNTTEDSTRFPQRCRTSDKANIAEWVTGSAVRQDLYESTKPINNAAKLGPYLIIYRDRGIHRVSTSTSTTRRFDIDPMVPNQGVASVGGVINTSENEHLFWGYDNFYIYQGGFDVVPVGDKIKTLVFGEAGQADPAFAHKQRLLFFEDFNEVLAVFQGIGDTFPKRGFMYKTDQGTWHSRDHTHAVHGGSKIASDISITWQTATGVWSAQNYPWNGAFLTTGSPTIVFASLSYTYQVSPALGDDDGTAFTRTIETKSFSESPYKGRVDFVEAKVGGGTILVEYSTDDGVSWQTYGTISAVPTLQWYRLYKQVVYENIRFRLSSATSGFTVLGFKFRVSPESEF